MHEKKSGLHMVTFLLLIIGGLNWLLLGLFNWEVGAIFGGPSAMISRIIYVLVGLSAIYELASHKNTCKDCGKSGEKMSSSHQSSHPTPGESSGEGGMEHKGDSDHS